jgi:deoxynucleoside triphosphate triphosphohydrolase SAMHD1
VYIGATHTRFEHCLGVAHLAEQMVSSIHAHQPYLPISSVDVLCIKIAGLCHDLGHGPFSHVFDGIYVKQLRRRGVVDEKFDWTHEQGSLVMFDHLLRANQIDVGQYGLEEVDLVFIKELIYGGPLPGSNALRGRTRPDQQFLYGFVNNAKSGLDVDKLDYFMRDARQTGAKASCDVEILIRNARVLVDRDDPNGALSICYPEKLVGQIMQAFRTRFELHQTVYQHKHVRAAEYMLCDVLLAANDHILIKNCRISDIVHHVVAYQHLDDRILARIEESESDGLSEARAIRQRMLARQCYDYVGSTTRTAYSQQLTEDRLLNEILASSPDRSLVQHHENVIVEFVQMHFGKGADDPIQYVRFFAKNSHSSSVCYQLPADSYGMYRPLSFQDSSIRVFVKQKQLVRRIRHESDIATRTNTAVWLGWPCPRSLHLVVPIAQWLERASSNGLRRITRRTNNSRTYELRRLLHSSFQGF